MDAAAAAQRLGRMVASDEDPVLTATALADLLVLAQRPDDNGNLPTNVATAAAWVASTLYAPGAVVQVSATARWWICVIGGTSATTAPSWPDLRGQARTGNLVGDNHVTWADAGGAWAPTWDLAAAAVEGWEQKAGLASSRFQFTTDGQMFLRQQVIAHCRQMADDYRRKMGAVVVDSC